METISNNLRVALYCRVSTEEQREGQTIASQVGELERYAREKSWIIIGVYKDEGWSGALLARPELDRLRDDATRGVFDAVLINDVDRLARDVTHLGVIKRDLENRAIRVIFRKLPGEQSPTHNLLVNILGSFAEFERELIADRTRRGKRHKVEVRQQFLGSIAPYGFKYLPRASSASGAGALEMLSPEAAMVRQMYRWIDEEGLSIQKVVVRLNQSGISPRKRGRAWQKSSVRRILRSEVYAGTWYYNKHQHCLPKKRSQNQPYRKSQTSLRLRPRSEWLPVKLPQNLRIIDPAKWRRVQEQLDRNIAFSPRNQRHSYLLTGLLRCGGCKAAYVGEPQHSRFAYRCSKRCKKYGSISEAWLNTTIWNAFSAALRNPKIIAEAIKETRAHAQVTAASNFEHEEIERSLKQIQAEEARILEAYRLQILSAEQLGRELDSLRARQKVLQSRQATLPKETQPDEAVVQRSLDEYSKLVRTRLTKLNRDERQRLLRLLLKSVIFEGERVRIQGIIPCADEPPLTEPATNIHHSVPAHIASTTSWRCARNDGPQSPEFLEVGSHPRPMIFFELIAKVERDTTARRTANLANLIKANEARKKLREAD
jgi:site-specific DNA recombinase